MYSRWTPSVAKRHAVSAFALLLTVALTSPHAQASYSDSQIRGVETEEEVQLNQIRDQEINQLKIVMGRRQSANRRPDILLRLAELYIEKYRHYFLKENEVHQALLKQGQKPRYVDHARSRAYLKSATAACNAILKSKVRFDKLDQVYYFLGYNAEESGNKNEALKFYRVVVERYPSSMYAAEAERNLAEGEFAKQNFRAALKWYERAARHTQLPSYPRNLYKLAWAYFKTKRYSDALGTMKRVVQLSANGEKFVGLKEEALNDLVMFYSEAGRPREARDYFSQIPGGPEMYVQALKRLAGVYERTGRHKLALNVNKELVNQYGESHPELTFDALGNNVEIYRKVGDSSGEESALRALVEFFAKHGDRFKGDNEERAQAFARTKNYLRSRATEIHKEAQKKNKIHLFSRAADLYGLYARAFLNNDDSDAAKRELSEIRIYRSDALIRANREQEALGELEKTLSEEGDSKRRREAGVSLLNILLKRIGAGLKGKSVSAELERHFLRVSEIYEDVFPKDELIPELRFKKARLKAVGVARGEVLPDDAKEALSELIEKYPSRPESVEAAYDLVASEAKAGKSDRAEKLSREFLANQPLMAADKKRELHNFLESVISRKSFSEIQNLEKHEEFDSAAKRYEELARTTKDQEVRVKALNNAAVNYENAGMRGDAIRLYEQLIHNHKNVPARAALKALASKALWTSDFAEAANLYYRFSKMSEYTETERRSFLATAYQLQWGLGQESKAYETLRSGLKSFCAPVSGEWCEGLLFDAVALALKSGNSKDVQDAADLLKGYLSTAPGRTDGKKVRRKPSSASGARTAEAYFRLGEIYERFGESAKARMNYEEASRVRPRGSREARYAAHAAFMMVEPEFARFNALKIDGNDKSRTRQKVQMLETLSAKYGAVVGLGDGEWGIAALERLGSAFLSFAAELNDVPPPAGLSPEGMSAYRKGIEGVTAPMAARGYESLKKAFDKGVALNVTSQTFVKISQTLSRKFPKQYPPAHYSLESKKGGGRASSLRLMGQSMPDLERWRSDLAKRVNGASAPGAEAWLEFGNLEALSGRPRIARLFFEEALRKSSKSVAAHNNLGVLSFIEGDVLEGTQSLLRAHQLGEFEKQAKFNLAKAYLAYHVFPKAREHLQSLATRDKEDLEVSQALAIAELGTGHSGAALVRLNALDAKDSGDFNLWYNWSVAVLAGGSDSEANDARERIKDGRGDGVERDMIRLAQDVFRK